VTYGLHLVFSLSLIFVEFLLNCLKLLHRSLFIERQWVVSKKLKINPKIHKEINKPYEGNKIREI
jgi:hypothetical protein